jgi:hypothetical protein
VSWGALGRILFLLVAAAFVTHTWLATADAVSRMQAEIVQIVLPRARRLPQRRWSFGFFALLAVVTCLTMLLNAPGPLKLTGAAIGFAGTVVFPAALYALNHRRLAPALPVWAHPGRAMRWLPGLAFLYLTLRG